jgi:hypothetical protein
VISAIERRDVMLKRLIAIGALGAGSLALATAAYAANCSSNSAVLNASQWVQTDYSYTDVSLWNGDDGKGYTAERIDGGGGMAYFQDVPNGGFHYFDNGDFSPWRKTSLYNWYNNNNNAGVLQQNNNGGCW